MVGGRLGANGRRGPQGLSLSFVFPDGPLPPRQQAQVLLCCGHGVRGQEARAACVSLPPPGEQARPNTCQEAGWKVATPGCCHCPTSLHRTGRYNTNRTPQWPPALTSTLQTFTFQVVPSHHFPGHVWDGCLGAWCHRGFRPLTSVCLLSTAMAFITYILVAGLALGTQDR